MGVASYAPALAVFGLALVARLGAAMALGSGFHFIDETSYVDAARRLLAGQGFAAAYNRVPAYPIFLALLDAALPPALVFLRSAQAIVAASGVVLCMALTARLFGRGAALVAGLLYALDPLLVITAALLYPEALAAILLAATTLACWHAAGRDRLAMSAAAGLALGVVAQLRPVALVTIPAFALWTAASTAASRRRRAAHALTLALVCVLSLVPWTWRNYRVHGKLMLPATAGTSNAPVAGADLDRQGLAVSLLAKAWTEPLVYARSIVREFGHFWELYPTRLTTDNPARRAELHRREPRVPTEASFPKTLRDAVSLLANGVELALMVVGVAVGWRRHGRPTALLVAVLFVYAFGHALILGRLRYRATVQPLVFALAGLGAAALLPGRLRSGADARHRPQTAGSAFDDRQDPCYPE